MKYILNVTVSHQIFTHYQRYVSLRRLYKKLIKAAMFV